MKLISIIEGHGRYLLNIRTSVMVHREEEYCKKCPLSHIDGRYTGKCSKSNGGCGCPIGAKTSQDDIWCKKGFWGNDWFKPDLFKQFLEDFKNN